MWKKKSDIEWSSTGVFWIFQYVRKQADGKVASSWYTPAERAVCLGMDDLATYLRSKQMTQLEKQRTHTPLLPRRAVQAHFGSGYSDKGPCVFVTQSVVWHQYHCSIHVSFM